MKSLVAFKKKGQGFSLTDAPGLILTLVIVGIIGAIGFVILGNLGASPDISAEGQTAINASEEALGAFFSLLPVLGIIFIAVIVLGAVVLLGMWMWRRNM